MDQKLKQTEKTILELHFNLHLSFSLSFFSFN